MKGNPLRGAGYLVRGLQMLPDPSIRHFVIIPLLVNILLFGGAIWLLFSQFEIWVDYLLNQMLPDWEWLQFLRYLLWPLLALVVLVIVYYSFTLVANFIAAPFNGFLSEKVERQLRGMAIGDEGWGALLAMIPRTVQRELAKLAYYLPRVLLLLVLTFVPVIGLISPLLWFLFGAWMMSIQYCDYPMDNNKVSFGQMKQLLKEERLTAVGFGGLVQVGMMVPLLNLVLMPAAVVGATLYWVEEHAPVVGASTVVRTTS
ncbi:MAG: sulfate transporter CysZ [Oceanospirillaceae bacterium]|nr:sulfate transporter CysZ [Oceanospirillaceae bacterium]